MRVTPMKARRVVDLIRGLPAAEAQAVLKFAPQAASEPVGKVLDSAIANAEQQPATSTRRRCSSSARRTSTRARPSSGSARAPGAGVPHPQAHQPHHGRRDAATASRRRRPEGRGDPLVGQKVNPHGFRLGITTEHKSRWFADSTQAGQRYRDYVKEDVAIRRMHDQGHGAGGHRQASRSSAPVTGSASTSTPHARASSSAAAAPRPTASAATSRSSPASRSSSTSSR